MSRVTAVSYPRREKRREANRICLAESARVLFASRGFSQTTMEEIAAKAELHVQTLYQHFSTKHALFTALEIISFREAVTARNADALSFWREYVKNSASGVMQQDGASHLLQYIKTERSDPKLTAARAEIRINSMDILAEGIAADFGLDQLTSRLPILAANMLWGGNADAVRRWSEQNDNLKLTEIVLPMADEVIGIVQRLIAAER